MIYFGYNTKTFSNVNMLSYNIHARLSFCLKIIKSSMNICYNRDMTFTRQRLSCRPMQSLRDVSVKIYLIKIKAGIKRNDTFLSKSRTHVFAVKY